MERKEFAQGILFTFSNYIYWLLMTNLLFVLANAVFIGFFMTLKPDFSNISLYLLALIPSGPAISALFYSMDKLLKTKELSPVSDFIHGYKSSIKTTLAVWISILAAYFILMVDLQYFQQSASSTNQALSIIISLLIVVLSVLSITIMAINSLYKFRIIDLLKLSVYYSFHKFKNSIGNVLILFIVGFASMMTTDFLIIFISSIVAFFIMLNTREILNDIELNFLRVEERSPYEQNTLWRGL
ncbi:YesL family protein [Mesobacillus foraminis]|uniref:YesL family protein n=1 Tax=Mesobacillus foraminis TaxID=279826 RepID=UPI00214BE5B3|nr:YesL family protein [Mesobacillus foraminis]